jgi:hypothetical protein
VVDDVAARAHPAAVQQAQRERALPPVAVRVPEAQSAADTAEEGPRRYAAGVDLQFPHAALRLRSRRPRAPA